MLDLSFYAAFFWGILKYGLFHKFLPNFSQLLDWLAMKRGDTKNRKDRKTWEHGCDPMVEANGMRLKVSVLQTPALTSHWFGMAVQRLPWSSPVGSNN